MTKGIPLVLNFDDCCLKYEEVFDPDIKEFYANFQLSPYLWKPEEFKKQKCWQNHFKNNLQYRLHKDFKFLVYSRFVIDNELQEHDLINVIEKRFEKSFPLKNINCVAIKTYICIYRHLINRFY